MTARPSDITAAIAPEEVRLQKFLASAGVASRRNCEELISTGRVTVDGEICSELGTTVNPETQDVRLDGERVKAESKRIYVLNKPAGYVCTNRDPTGRPLAVDLVPDVQRRLFSVGRLDEESEGLLLVTNDGDLANRLAHPRYSVSRRYQVQVVGNPTYETIKELTKGMRFSDGFFRAKGVKRIRTQGKSTYLEIELTEGHNRELRRLLARVGHKVLSLKRVTFGPIKLGGLALGKSRTLRPTELQALHDLVNSGDGTRSPAGRRRSKRSPAPGRRSAGKTSRAGNRGGSPRGKGRSSGKRNSSGKRSSSGRSTRG